MISSIDELLEGVETLRQEGRYQELIQLFTQAIEMRPDSASLYVNRGASWASEKKYDKAIEDFNRALVINPDKVSALHGLGDARTSKKEYDLALQNLDKAIALRPDSYQLYFSRGNTWTAKKEYDKAVEDYDRVIAMQPDFASAYTNRGDALRHLDEYDDALLDYRRSIEIAPVNRRAYFGLGRAFEALQEPALASMHYKRAFHLKYDGAVLVNVFHERLPAPYIVKSILAGSQDNKSVEANFSTMEWLIAACKGWDTFLDQLRRRDFPSTDPALYHSLEAIVNYYMGNSIAAYQIFDTQFDTDEHPYPLTLRDQYYLVLSAVDFKEPDNGLAYAIEQAKKEDGSDPVSTYYAGQLHLLLDDTAAAMQCFDACDDYLPALYGKMAVYRLAGNETALLRTAEAIAAAEAAPGCDTGFLDGIGPLVLDGGSSPEALVKDILQLLPYYELQEEIAITRELLNRQPTRRHPAFNALLTIA